MTSGKRRRRRSAKTRRKARLRAQIKIVQQRLAATTVSYVSERLPNGNVRWTITNPTTAPVVVDIPVFH